MPELFPTDFSIESNLAQPCDVFEARYPGAATFLGRTAETVVTLAPGLYDDVGIATVSEQITQGLVSEWEFDRQVSGGEGAKEVVATRVRGFDATKKLLDTWFRKRYVRTTSAAPLTSAFLVPGNTTIGTIPEVRGVFTYMDVARDACAAAGLTLAWQLPTPEIQGDFTANGRVLDILTGLAEPWTNALPRRADVYVLGTTVIVRQRDAVPASAAAITVQQLRPQRVRLIVRPPKPIGLVIVRGQDIPKSAQTVILNPNDPVTVTVNTETTAATYDYLYGGPPNGVLARGDKKVYAKAGGGTTLVARQLITNDWDTLLFDGGQPTGLPQQRRGFSEFEGVDDFDKAFRTLRTELRTFSYDSEGYLTEERTLIRKLARAKDFLGLRDTELSVRTIVGEGPLLISDDTLTFTPNSELGFFASGDVVRWKLKGHTAGTAGGHRPGGPGRRVRPTAGARPGTNPTIVASEGTAGARAIEIRAPDLTQQQCQQIHDQLRAWAAAWEYEVVITAPTLPWLKRGAALQLVGVLADDGTPIPSSPMTVYELSIRHDESSPRASSTMTVRAGWWA